MEKEIPTAEAVDLVERGRIETRVENFDFAAEVELPLAADSAQWNRKDLSGLLWELFLVPTWLAAAALVGFESSDWFQASGLQQTSTRSSRIHPSHLSHSSCPSEPPAEPNIAAGYSQSPDR